MSELRVDGPSDSPLRLLLAHGAGAGMDSDFMRETAAGLAARGVWVARFEFPYMERRRHGRRSLPDRAPILLDAYRRVVAQLGAAESLVIGGKSMGGRMASMLADELRVRGLVCFGYPFHPPKRPDQLRTAHLGSLLTETLIVQGARDPFGTRREIARYALSPRIRVHFIADGDHDLVPRKRSGFSAQAARDSSLDSVVKFIRDLPVARTG
jgi:predicted alpha/beta-hydrolase family hydrolase